MVSLETALNPKLFEQSFAQKIATELFDFSKPGGLMIPNAIMNLDQILSQVENFPAWSEMYQSGTEYSFRPFPDQSDLPSEAKALQQSYSDFYQLLSPFAKFKGGKINSVDFLMYNQGNTMPAHFDSFQCWNLVGIFTLAGSADFQILENEEIVYDVNPPPGSLVLLRAHRKEKEFDKRPMHRVVNVTEKRYAITMRYNTFRESREIKH